MIMSTKEICKRGLSMTISLTLGNSGFPFGDGCGADAHRIGQLLLGQSPGAAQALDVGSDGKFHFTVLLRCFWARFYGIIITNGRTMEHLLSERADWLNALPERRDFHEKSGDVCNRRI